MTLGATRGPLSGARFRTPVTLCRCGSRTAVPSGGRRAPWSPHPPRLGPREVQAGTARPRRTRMMSTISRWTRTQTTRRSACCCASTEPLSRCLAWARTASDPGPAAQAGLPLPFPCSQLRAGGQRRGAPGEGEKKRKEGKRGGGGSESDGREERDDGERGKGGDGTPFCRVSLPGPLAGPVLREREQVYCSREPGCGTLSMR